MEDMMNTFPSPLHLSLLLIASINNDLYTRFCDLAGVILVSLLADSIVYQIVLIPFQKSYRPFSLACLFLFIRYLTPEAVKLGEGSIRLPIA